MIVRDSEQFNKVVGMKSGKKEDFTIMSIRKNKLLESEDGTRFEFKPKPKKGYDHRLITDLFKRTGAQAAVYLKRMNYNPPTVEARFTSTKRNIEMFQSLPDGQIMYLVDIRHCYWRIAYNMGIINHELYYKYRDSQEHKLYRNMALASLTSPRSVKYYQKGVESREILEVNNLNQRLYNNIRYTSYNIFGELMANYSDFIAAYMTDGALIMPEVKTHVHTLLREQNMYSIFKLCYKVNSNSYMIHGEGVKTL